MPNLNLHMPAKFQGFTLIEVLITMLIVAIALLGLAGLQVTSLNSQFESYQRAQAMLLLEDMANRIRANNLEARSGAYTVGTLYGLTTIEDCSTKLTIAERDLCEWNAAIAGADITFTVDGSDQNAGSILAARGCIETVPGSLDGEAIVRLAIAWQGMSPTKAPPDTSTCGKDQYGSPDSFRRVARLDTVLAKLPL